MTIPPVANWWNGDPDAVDVGVKALRRLRAFRPGSDDVRAAVRLLQKRWKEIPTGCLSAAQWDRLVGGGETHDAAESDAPSA